MTGMMTVIAVNGSSPIAPAPAPASRKIPGKSGYADPQPPYADPSGTWPVARSVAVSR